MKKIMMLSTAVLLAMSSIAISQAEEATTAHANTTIEEAAQDNANTSDEAKENSTDDASSEDAKAKEDNTESIPKDTPQVQRLIEAYPRLVARIRPYGRVCFKGEECDVTVTDVGGSSDGKPRDGEAVYNAVCHTCHANGLLGSPKFGDKSAWAPRISKGMDTLHKHAIEGFNAMPAKGGADIPDEEVINAVDYMVGHAK